MQTAGTITFTIHCTDRTDVDWLASKLVPAIKKVMLANEDRLEGNARVMVDVEGGYNAARKHG